jgi:hypothetical protein
MPCSPPAHHRRLRQRRSPKHVRPCPGKPRPLRRRQMWPKPWSRTWPRH